MIKFTNSQIYKIYKFFTRFKFTYLKTTFCTLQVIFQTFVDPTFKKKLHIIPLEPTHTKKLKSFWLASGLFSVSEVIVCSSIGFFRLLVFFLFYPYVIFSLSVWYTFCFKTPPRTLISFGICHLRIVAEFHRVSSS